MNYLCSRPSRILVNLSINFICVYFLKAHLWVNKFEKSTPHKVDKLFEKKNFKTPYLGRKIRKRH